MERPEVQPPAYDLFQHPVEFTLRFVRITLFELRCEDIIAAVIAEFPHGTGQTVGLAAPIDLPHTALECVVDVVRFQGGVSARQLRDGDLATARAGSRQAVAAQ